MPNSLSPLDDKSNSFAYASSANMFFAFKLAEGAAVPEPPPEKLPSSRRKSIVIRACQPCRERKIRCTGSLPCRACQWHHRATQCRYTDATQRADSKRPTGKTSQQISRRQQDILQTLFPDVNQEQLSGLSRSQLISLISKDSSSDLPSPLASQSNGQPTQVENPDAADLAALQLIPEQGIVTPVRKIKPRKDIQDDFSALMFSLKQPSSYLGISSVIAVLRVIDRLHPEVHEILLREKSAITSQRQAISDPPSPSPSIPEPSFLDHSISEKLGTSSAWDEIPLINSFFSNVHPVIPLIGEHNFRHTYLQNQRTDNRWMLLLSVVLAMGKLAVGPTQLAEHRPYYARIKQYLTIETLDVAHPETIQALAILGGFYLHHLQLPNLAHSLMGATMRLATALCLHREYPDGIVGVKTEDFTTMVETRRRIWWCLYILEAWSGTSLGRPSAGCSESAVTTRYPQEPIGISNDVFGLLQDNIRFSIVTTRMEEALAVSPLIDEKERTALDTAYEECYLASAVQERATEPRQAASMGVSVAQNITRWRYKWARILLHRPVLLWHTITRAPFKNLSEDRKTSIRLCREITRDLIKDISTTWRGRSPSIMAAWGATWHLYQAAMVPLLAFFSDSQDKFLLEDSAEQVKLAEATLSSLQDHWTSAGPSLETITLLHEASQKKSAKIVAIEPQIGHNSVDAQEAGLPVTPTRNGAEDVNHSSTPNNLYATDQRPTMDDMFDSLDWNQYIGYGHDHNITIGFGWEPYDPRMVYENSEFLAL